MTSIKLQVCLRFSFFWTNYNLQTCYILVVYLHFESKSCVVFFMLCCSQTFRLSQRMKVYKNVDFIVHCNTPVSCSMFIYCVTISFCFLYACKIHFRTQFMWHISCVCNQQLEAVKQCAKQIWNFLPLSLWVCANVNTLSIRKPS